MVGREEIEIMPVNRLTVRQVAVAAGLGVDGLEDAVMVVHQHTHARVVARERAVMKGRIGRVETVVGLAVERMFLEVPAAAFVRRAGCFGRRVAVEEQGALVVVFHDE